MKSMSEIMAEVNAQVAASRFTRAACGGAAEPGVIREERITRRRGVVAVAKKTGCHPSHITRVLSGEREPGKALERKLRKLGIKLRKEAV